MTQNKNIQDLLYFKAFKDKKTIKLKSNTNKEYDKFKIKQDKLYKSDFDNFLNEARMIENGSDKNE